jgi:hypothetical protein
MGAHIGKIVDPNSEAHGHLSKRTLHGGRVLSKGPRAASPVARKNHVHRTTHANGALEFATSTPDGAAVLGPHELSVYVVREK